MFSSPQIKDVDESNTNNHFFHLCLIQEKHVMSSPRASRVRSYGDSNSDVSSSSDSAELMLGECVEMKDKDKREMSLAQPEFTGLWEHKHKDDMVTISIKYISM